MTTNWRPISEKPELEADGFSKPVLLFMEDYSAVGFWTQRGHWMVRGMKIVEPTHWCEITPPAEPVPQGYAEITIGGVKTLAKMDTASSLVIEHHVSGGTLMMVAGDLADLRRDAERCDDLAAALSDLYAMVNGECPSLLNEDSGGNAELDLRISALLAEQKKRAAVDALPDQAE